TEVRELTEDWIREYNEERIHGALNDLTPWEYFMKYEQVKNSNYKCN
ncbi:MAG: integrase core domain-containing protein, partial [Vibrio sp.]